MSRSLCYFISNFFGGTLLFTQIPTTLLVRTTSVADHVNKHNEHPNYLKGEHLQLYHIIIPAIIPSFFLFFFCHHFYFPCQLV